MSVYDSYYYYEQSPWLTGLFTFWACMAIYRTVRRLRYLGMSARWVGILIPGVVPLGPGWLLPIGEMNRVVVFDLLLVTRRPSVIPCVLQVLAYALIVYLATRTKVEGERIVPDGSR